LRQVLLGYRGHERALRLTRHFIVPVVMANP
jgi:hypothetical protein